MAIIPNALITERDSPNSSTPPVTDTSALKPIKIEIVIIALPREKPHHKNTTDNIPKIANPTKGQENINSFQSCSEKIENS